MSRGEANKNVMLSSQTRIASHPPSRQGESRDKRKEGKKKAERKKARASCIFGRTRIHKGRPTVPATTCQV